MKLYREIVNFIKEIYGAERVSLHEPVFFGKEKEYLIGCIESTQVSYIGEFVSKFEKIISEYTGSKYTSAVVNGTTGLHIALKALGVCPGDEVITQPLTFVATVNAIAYCGAYPVFVDVDMETLGMSPESLKRFIDKHYKPKDGKFFNRITGRKISAIVPVHVFGHPCKIDEIVQIAEGYHIPVIEDAAEALGSFYKEKHCGTFGKVGVISFNGNKIITTGGGGAVITDDPEIAQKIKHLIKTAKIPHPYEYIHDQIGYNYRMPNINAAIGVAQMEYFDIILETKRKLAEKYREFFELKDFLFINEPKGARSNFWLNGIFFSAPEEKVEFLNFSIDSGVQCRSVWRLMTDLPMYRNSLSDQIPNSRLIQERVVNIPSGIPKKFIIQ